MRSKLIIVATVVASLVLASQMAAADPVQEQFRLMEQRMAEMEDRLQATSDELRSAKCDACTLDAQSMDSHRAVAVGVDVACDLDSVQSGLASHFDDESLRHIICKFGSHAGSLMQRPIHSRSSHSFRERREAGPWASSSSLATEQGSGFPGSCEVRVESQTT